MNFGNTCRFEAGACPVTLIIKIMEKKKNVFGDIKSMLTRDQMKQIKGGSGGGGCANDCPCPPGYTCMMMACGGQAIYAMCG